MRQIQKFEITFPTMPKTDVVSELHIKIPPLPRIAQFSTTIVSAPDYNIVLKGQTGTAEQQSTSTEMTEEACRNGFELIFLATAKKSGGPRIEVETFCGPWRIGYAVVFPSQSAEHSPLSAHVEIYEDPREFLESDGRPVELTEKLSGPTFG